ncbi:hypothetical protein ACOI8O_03715 [Bifidobacterium adolescentis]|uniref:hypothetical protein n=1 Tax=Bifidobacterium adolescentis TaxID=1680 RepID=UPI003D045BB6
MPGSNKARDTRRDIAKAIRESQQNRMDALEAFAQGLTEIKTLRTRLKTLEAHVDGELRAKAKAAGNTTADIKNVERIVNEHTIEPTNTEPNANPDVTPDMPEQSQPENA